MTEAYDSDALIRAKNRRLGLILGGIALAIMGWALIRFTMGGLPADKDLYEDQQQEASAEEISAQ